MRSTRYSIRESDPGVPRVASTLPSPPAAERVIDRGKARVRRALVALSRFARRKPMGVIGGIIVIALFVMAAFAERVAPCGYDDPVRGARMRARSTSHYLGTDNLSRDIWSRVVYGARVSVTVGVLTMSLALFLATTIGVSSGYFGGTYDLLIQRLVDAWLSFPYLVIVLSVMAVLGPGLLNVVISLSVIIAAVNARVIRAATLTVIHSTYVEAARAIGAGHRRVILRHVLPNVTATIIILGTIGLGTAILAESALSFLGFGVPPPYPSWGGMLSGSGRTYMLRAPWMAVWPGVAI